MTPILNFRQLKNLISRNYKSNTSFFNKIYYFTIFKNVNINKYTASVSSITMYHKYLSANRVEEHKYINSKASG